MVRAVTVAYWKYSTEYKLPEPTFRKTSNCKLGPRCAVIPRPEGLANHVYSVHILILTASTPYRVVDCYVTWSRTSPPLFCAPYPSQTWHGAVYHSSPDWLVFSFLFALLFALHLFPAYLETGGLRRCCQGPSHQPQLTTVTGLRFSLCFFFGSFFLRYRQETIDRHPSVTYSLSYCM